MGITESAEPVTVEVGTHDFRRRGWATPKYLKCTPRLKALGTATLTVADTDPRIADLRADGARVRIHYLGEYQMSGWVDTSSGLFPTVQGEKTFNIIDDSVLLDDVLGFPNPTLPTEKQGANDTEDVEAYYTVTGPAETVVKNLVTANAIQRLGMSHVVCAPDLGRGAVITVKIRMTSLRDQLYPAIVDAGVGVTVREVNGKLVVDCFEPKPYPRTVSESSGIVVGGSYSIQAPTVTRAIVGGGGEGRDRVFRRTIETATETAYGRPMEAFRDAKDAGSEWDKLLDDIARARETMDKAGDKKVNEDHDAAKAQFDYQQALNHRDLTNSTGTASQKTSAQNQVDSALTRKNTAEQNQADALADFQTREAEYNALVASKPAALTRYNALMAERAAQTLADGQRTGSLSLLLAETDTFRYGGKDGVQLFSRIPVEVGPGIVIPDDVTEVDIEYSKDKYYLATPILGDRPDDPDRALTKSLAALFKSQRKTNTR